MKSHVFTSRLAHALAAGALLSACGAGPGKSAPAQAPSSPATSDERAGAAPPPAAAPPTDAPQPYPQEAPGATTDATRPVRRPEAQGSPNGGLAPAPDNRAVAVQNAAREVEASQRELDVAAGDCRNACRALGSMDRATGRLCGLAQGNVEGHRCDEAKSRVYSARARVKATCGTCEGGPSVERGAPIPSLR